MPLHKIAKLVPDSWKLGFFFAAIFLILGFIVFAAVAAARVIGRHAGAWIGDTAGVAVFFLVFVLLFVVGEFFLGGPERGDS